MRVLVTAAVGAAGLSVAGTASGATYCVGLPCVGGTSVPDLQAGLDAAAASAEADVVQISPGTYVGAFDYDAASPVEVVGAGVERTLLRNPAVVDDETLSVRSGAPGSVVRDMSIEGGPVNAMSSDALLLRGASGTRLRLTATMPARGLSTAGVSSLADSTIAMPGGGYAIVNSGDLTLERVQVSGAGTGYTQIYGEPSATIAGSTFDAAIGITASDGPVTVTNTLIRAGTGIMARPQIAGHAPSIVGRHLTLVGTSADPENFGAGAVNSEAGALGSIVTINSSVISGFPAAVFRYGMTGTADISVRYSDLYPRVISESGTGTTAVSDDISAEPGFVGPADLRPRADSPLVNAGDPADQPAFGPVDLAGQPRVAGGRRDIGAYEYQPAPGPPTGPPVAPPPADTTAPAVSKARVRKVKTARRLSFTSSEAGTTRLVIERRLPHGRRKGRACVAPTRALRRARPCARFRAVVRVPKAVRAGANVLALPAKVRRRALPAGSYRVRFRVVDAAGNASREVSAAFVVAAPKRAVRR
ncbi:MAG: choice-of-anchor Q domain-containing protein [Thermoleophilia bacterium]